MLNPDFTDRTYVAEVLKTRTDGGGAFDSIAKLTINAESAIERADTAAPPIRLGHGFVSTPNTYHRFPRVIRTHDGSEVHIPRQKTTRGRTVNLYDVLIAQRQKHVVIAVPFHEMAEEFFPQVDEVLAGTGMRYEKLDITAMVIRLGAAGTTLVNGQSHGSSVGVSVTRCHLAYADQVGRTANLQQVRITGANLGASEQYGMLISPVLKPSDSALTVTPIVLGFALVADGVRKSSAITDRHGNFKLWVASGLRRLIRLFDLLETLEELKNVVSTTSNIPIMQSRTIREAEDQNA